MKELGHVWVRTGMGPGKMVGYMMSRVRHGSREGGVSGRVDLQVQHHLVIAYCCYQEEELSRREGEEMQ